MQSIKGAKVFVIATVNNAEKLLESLKRPGRFDIHLHMGSPRR